MAPAAPGVAGTECGVLGVRDERWLPVGEAWRLELWWLLWCDDDEWWLGVGEEARLEWRDECLDDDDPKRPEKSPPEWWLGAAELSRREWWWDEEALDEPPPSRTVDADRDERCSRECPDSDSRAEWDVEWDEERWWEWLCRDPSADECRLEPDLTNRPSRP